MVAAVGLRILVGGPEMAAWLVESTPGRRGMADAAFWCTRAGSSVSSQVPEGVTSDTVWSASQATATGAEQTEAEQLPLEDSWEEF